MDLREQLVSYRPFNEQEEKDRDVILSCLDQFDDLYTRDNRTAHLTASAWVTDRSHTKILMVYHNLYDSWSWLGGHADGDTDLLQTALREVREESGITHVRPLSDEIFSLEVLTVDGHEKNGEYVSSHLHLNVTYLLEADADEEVHVKKDENSGVAWFTPEEAVKASTEPWFQTRIYAKLNEKMREVIHD
ncbi:MAG: NUDIX hydrolase [Solobacterium sp.]|nr:NUDIX hydrolase [Solobacterium sp.]